MTARYAAALLVAALALTATWLLTSREHTFYVNIPGPTTTAPGPTVTATNVVKVKVPGPTVTVRVVDETSRGNRRTPLGWDAGEWQRFPASVERAALCIAGYESATAGLWLAENPVSTASGFAQWIDGTWQAWTARAGTGTRYAHASAAPPRVQAAVFAWQWTHGGRSAWSWSCPA